MKNKLSVLALLLASFFNSSFTITSSKVDNKLKGICYCFAYAVDSDYKTAYYTKIFENAGKSSGCFCDDLDLRLKKNLKGSLGFNVSKSIFINELCYETCYNGDARSMATKKLEALKKDWESYKYNVVFKWNVGME